MKRNLLSVFAVVLALAISSFTTRVDTIFYMVYDGSSTQRDITSFDQETINPGIIAGTSVLAWFSIQSADAQVDNSEFLAAFDALDESQPKNNSLNSEGEKTKSFTYGGVSKQTVLELKNP